MLEETRNIASSQEPYTTADIDNIFRTGMNPLVPPMPPANADNGMVYFVPVSPVDGRTRRNLSDLQENCALFSSVIYPETSESPKHFSARIKGFVQQACDTNASLIVVPLLLQTKKHYTAIVVSRQPDDGWKTFTFDPEGTAHLSEYPSLPKDTRLSQMELYNLATSLEIGSRFITSSRKTLQVIGDPHDQSCGPRVAYLMEYLAWVGAHGFNVEATMAHMERQDVAATRHRHAVLLGMEDARTHGNDAKKSPDIPGMRGATPRGLDS